MLNHTFLSGAVTRDGNVSNSSYTFNNETQRLIAELILSNNVKYRMSTMLLIAFNMALAALTVAIVFYDAWRTVKKSPLLKTEKRHNFFHMIHPAEVVPLSVSAAILAQGAVFLTAQSMGIDSIFISDCRDITQLVFPAVWIVGLVLLIFGMEMVYRALKRNRFAPRGRWSITICWAIILIMLLFSWIPTRVRQTKHDKCFASLLSFTLPWSDVAFAFSFILIVLYVTIGSILVVQLLRTAKLDRSERISASRMVYYLGLAAAIFLFVIPLWGRITFRQKPGVTLMMATVALNVFGLVYSFFHLLLRSHADSMAIHPRTPPLPGNRKWNLFGSNTLDIGHHINAPVTMQSEGSLRDLSRSSSQRSNHAEGDTASFLNKPDPYKSLPPPPASSGVPGHFKKRSQYSIFPTKESARQLLHPSSSIYDDGILLQPPRAPFTNHQRHSSDISMATVQIGLRLSNIAAAPAVSFSKQKSQIQPLSPLQPLSRPSAFPDATNHFSISSLDVPVTLRSPTTSQSSMIPDSLMPRPVPTATDNRSWTASPGPKKALDLSATMKNLPPHPPLKIRRRTSVTERDQDSDVASQETVTSPTHADSWPLRTSSDILLPQKTYRPNDKNDNLWI